MISLISQTDLHVLVFSKLNCVYASIANLLPLCFQSKKIVLFDSHSISEQQPLIKRARGNINTNTEVCVFFLLI